MSKKSFLSFWNSRNKPPIIILPFISEFDEQTSNNHPFFHFGIRWANHQLSFFLSFRNSMSKPSVIILPFTLEFDEQASNYHPFISEFEEQVYYYHPSSHFGIWGASVQLSFFLSFRNLRSKRTTIILPFISEFEEQAYNYHSSFHFGIWGVSLQLSSFLSFRNLRSKPLGHHGSLFGYASALTYKSSVIILHWHIKH